MAEKKIIVGAINITMQPHSPEMYVKLFKLAHKLRKIVKLNKTTGGLLAGLAEYRFGDEKIKPIIGDIWRFTQINMDDPWVNIETNDIASDDELNSIVIPAHLRPNGSRFSYFFYPDKHIVFYESYYDKHSLAASVAEKFFRELFSLEEIVDKFGEVEVTHFPDIKGLEDALNIPFKKRVEAIFTRPNPDTFAKEEAVVLNRMKKKNVRRIEQTYISEKDKSINVDEELRIIAKIAAKNGSLTIKGRDFADKPVEYSTTSVPFMAKEYYEPKEEPLIWHFMYRITKKLKDLLVDKLT